MVSFVSSEINIEPLAFKLKLFSHFKCHKWVDFLFRWSTQFEFTDPNIYFYLFQYDQQAFVSFLSSCSLQFFLVFIPIKQH